MNEMLTVWEKRRIEWFAKHPKCKICGGGFNHYSRNMICRECQKTIYKNKVKAREAVRKYREKKKMAKKYKPFRIRDQFLEWCSRNCGTCKKGWEERRLIFRCEWERAIYVAMVDDGQITEEVAKAIGFLDSEGCDLWECPGWVRR